MVTERFLTRRGSMRGPAAAGSFQALPARTGCSPALWKFSSPDARTHNGPRRVGLFRFTPAPFRLTLAKSRRPEQLLVRSDAMHDHGAPPHSVYQQEVGAQMALREATPLLAPLPEAMLMQRRWKPLSGDQDVEDVLERLNVEFGVLTSISIVALEAREND